MRTALHGVPEKNMERPENLATVRINSKTGKLAAENEVDAIFETFRSEFAPTQKVVPGMSRGAEAGSEEIIPEQLI